MVEWKKVALRTSLACMLGLGIGCHQAYGEIKQTLQEVVTNFKDTKKPNAVILQPGWDVGGTFSENYLIKKVKEKYDTAIMGTDCEGAVYNLLDSIPDIELLILKRAWNSRNTHSK